jgi:hypothetical protein
MSLKATMIQSFARFVLGSNVFERVKGVVLRQEDKELSGAEKRHAALEEIKLIGLGIATWALNFAIEIAVAYFRTLSGEKIDGK